MGSNDNKNKDETVRVDGGAYKKIKKHADKDDRTIKATITRMVDKYDKKEEEK